jgi:hypothetical protein
MRVGLGVPRCTTLADGAGVDVSRRVPQSVLTGSGL